ncbi:MAG: hypothetical protein GY801_06330, partial [bacterium]|nr:hypothetical protein [bacterium]
MRSRFNTNLATVGRCQSITLNRDLPVHHEDRLRLQDKWEETLLQLSINTKAYGTMLAEYAGALGGLAQRLVRELGMPAVVAMTEKVSIATAEALAGSFYVRLREHGRPDLALTEAGGRLAERGDVTVPALYSRLGGRPLFSDSKDRELTSTEIEDGLSKVEGLLKDRAPVLQEKFQQFATTLRGMSGAQRDDLSPQARDEWDRGLREVNTICEEVLDLNFRALVLGQDPPTYDERCPFQGLYPFYLHDREFFFGREALVQTLKQTLEQNRFLAVLGPSGSGKSSVVLAGLIPVLQAQELNFRIAYLTPGSHPLSQLETILTKLDGRSGVVVVDQFEELFTL